MLGKPTRSGQLEGPYLSLFPARWNMTSWKNFEMSFPVAGPVRPKSAGDPPGALGQACSFKQMPRLWAPPTHTAAPNNEGDVAFDPCRGKKARLASSFFGSGGSSR